MSSQPASGAPSKAHSHREIMVIMSGLMTGMLLAALDQTIVSTALKTIVIDLHGLKEYTWVVTAYLLTSTASTPLYGKISDLYGRRIVFQFAIVTFLIGSFLAGVSQNMSQLIATRALQGLGAGGLMALTFVIIGDIVPPRERGRYQGYFGLHQRRSTERFQTFTGAGLFFNLRLLHSSLVHSLQAFRKICHSSLPLARFKVLALVASWLLLS